MLFLLLLIRSVWLVFCQKSVVILFCLNCTWMNLFIKQTFGPTRCGTCYILGGAISDWMQCYVNMYCLCSLFVSSCLLYLHVICIHISILKWCLHSGIAVMYETVLLPFQNQNLEYQTLIPSFNSCLHFSWITQPTI
jgi:hypothetical protein